MVRTMLFLYLAGLVVCFLALQGCEESFTPEQVQQWAGTVQDLSSRVDEYQDTTTEAIGKLTDVGVIGSDVGETVGKIGTEIDRIQPQLAAITEAIQKAELAGEEDMVQWLKLLQAANESTAAANPYSGYIATGLGGITAIMTALAAKKSKDAKTATGKYRAHKRGIEKSMKMAASGTGAISEFNIYENIAKARADLGVV